MPVTKTAKRALRVAHTKTNNNKRARVELSTSIRIAKRTKSVEKIRKAISISDRAAKKHVIHKNKASRIKQTLSRLLPKK